MQHNASDSFLPRIQSVFYAIFDVRQGPKIVHQVPEGLIAVPSPGPSMPTSGSVPPTPPSEAPTATSSSRTSFTAPDPEPPNRSLSSSQKQPLSASSALFNFDEISKYVIPPSDLCGRLVTCSTKRHRIIGFPCALKGRYQRNYLIYNLCFVFDREADLRCYEPIIRKISRVLTSCEEESGFLSSADKSPSLHTILEQLYEDLNSYSETSIVVDHFNTLELKIFPYYPNPPTVKDWMVPLALININKRIEDNWDLTMVKVCKYIDGVNHVSRIAHLADCDKELTRLAIAHLLYYQVIMVIDIFQFSNMYTLHKNVQWLATERHVRDECGPYVTKPGRQIPDWPQLLHLYSRLKPGTTVLEWMQTYSINHLGIDVRRFVSFGVIKGFLHRVHRWPVLLSLPDVPSDATQSAHGQVDPHDITELPRRRGQSLSNANVGPFGPDDQSNQPSVIRGRPTPADLHERGASHPAQLIGQPGANGTIMVAYGSIPAGVSATRRARRASAAEKFLEQLRNKDLQRTVVGPLSTSPHTTWMHKPKDEGSRSRAASMLPTFTATAGANSATEQQPSLAVSVKHGSPHKNPNGSPPDRKVMPVAPHMVPVAPPPSPVFSKATLPPPPRPRLSRSPSAPHLAQQGQNLATLGAQPAHTKGPHRELIPLLDGDHHTDELAVRFEAGWHLLEQWLIAIGGGKGSGDYGQVEIIYQ